MTYSQGKMYAKRTGQPNPLSGADLQLGGPVASLLLPGGAGTDGSGSGHRPFQVSGILGRHRKIAACGASFERCAIFMGGDLSFPQR